MKDLTRRELLTAIGALAGSAAIFGATGTASLAELSTLSADERAQATGNADPPSHQQYAAFIDLAKNQGANGSLPLGDYSVFDGVARLPIGTTKHFHDTSPLAPDAALIWQLAYICRYLVNSQGIPQGDPATELSNALTAFGFPNLQAPAGKASRHAVSGSAPSIIPLQQSTVGGDYWLSTLVSPALAAGQTVLGRAISTDFVDQNRQSYPPDQQGLGPVFVNAPFNSPETQTPLCYAYVQADLPTVPTIGVYEASTPNGSLFWYGTDSTNIPGGYASTHADAMMKPLPALWLIADPVQAKIVE